MTLSQTPSDPGSSFWVAANAGSGKTTLITQRLLRLLLNGILPEKILCITFTKAAAAEIYGRINRTLTDWAITGEKELERELKSLTGKNPREDDIIFARQLFTNIVDRPGSLKIQTIHAFCQAVLGRFPLEAGLAPHSRIIDERTSEELLEEAKRRILISRDDIELARSVENLAGSLHEKQFDKMMREIIHQRIRLEKFFSNNKKEKITQNIRIFLGLTENADENSLISEMLEINGELQKLIKNLKPTKPSDAEKIASLQELIASREPNHKAYMNFFLTAKMEQRKNLLTKETFKSNPEVEQLLKKEQERVFRLSERLKSLLIAKNTFDFLNIAEALIGVYNYLKKSHSFLDYDDLIAKTLQLLSARELSAWVMYKLDGGIDHILVDEAQDTSPEQWQIIENIALEFFSGQGSGAGKTVFFVGDEKQSIFSFQGADQKMFAEMHDRFAALATTGRKRWFSTDLKKSYRSTAAILTAVDLVFASDEYRAAITSSKLPIKHDLERAGHPGKVEIWPLINMPQEDIAENYDPKNIKARVIGDQIAKWLIDGRALPGKGRKITPGDIMILVRKRDEFIDYLVRILKKHGVPVAGADRMILTRQIAIMDLMALAHFLLLPDNDLNLAAVLKGPFIGCNDDDLLEIAYGRESQSLWQRLQDKKSERQIFSKAYDYLSEILESSAHLRPFEFFSYILEKNAGREKIIARLGRQVEDPINEFLSLAFAYEKNRSSSLQGFLHWLGRGELEIKRDFDHALNEVKIMTVHAAKGLESPIVFLADTTTAPGETPRLLWNKTAAGEMPLYIMKTEQHNSYTEISAGKKKSGAHEEYLRLLYVAMTRAEDELYIVGNTGADGKIDKKSWYQIITDELLKSAGQVEIREFVYPEYVKDYEKKALFIENTGNKFPVQKPLEMERGKKTALPQIFTKSSQNESNKKQIDLYTLISDKDSNIAAFLHKLNIPNENNKIYLAKYLNEHFSKNEILKSLIREFFSSSANAQFFSENSSAKIPIIGKIGGKIAHGQIDRLLISENQIDFLVFYSEDPEISFNFNITAGYYKELLEKIYPDHAINGFALSLKTMQLSEIIDKIGSETRVSAY